LKILDQTQLYELSLEISTCKLEMATLEKEKRFRKIAGRWAGGRVLPQR
jgi:hypothetical protein